MYDALPTTQSPLFWLLHEAKLGARTWALPYVYGGFQFDVRSILQSVPTICFTCAGSK